MIQIQKNAQEIGDPQTDAFSIADSSKNCADRDLQTGSIGPLEGSGRVPRYAPVADQIPYRSETKLNAISGRGHFADSVLQVVGVLRSIGSS